MFGYVLTDKPSLRIREFDYYRATYCGLCHAMGKCTGCISRLTLSYDMTFFVLLREMLDGVNVEFEKKRCPRHPLRAIDTVKTNPELRYCAYVSGIMTAGKIRDSISDENGAKRTLARLLGLVFSKMEKESEDALPELSHLVRDKLAELSELEKNEVASIDKPADIFGQIMASLLSFGLDGEKKLIADKIGNRVGRWVYMVDAFDDYERDRKSGSYNPFVLLYGKADFSEDDMLSVSSMLEAELAIAMSAIDLLDDDADANRSEIIKNILCLGMPASVRRVCDRKTKDKDKNKS
ncbi:MAG: DUF5685 family protein [Eubacteriales bacterium]